MKPSHLAQSRWSAARLIGLLILLIAVGCAGGAPAGGDDTNNDDPPPKVKQPPMPKDGSSTVAGCDGIPESGQCQDGVATYCDLAAGELRRKDCKALGKSCLVDSTRGAVCETVAPGGEGETSCDTGVTFEGTCGGAGGQTAVWCDPLSSQTISWDCSSDGLSCTIDDCGFGAYCCGSGVTPPPTNECATLGFFGECGGADGNTARWCNSTTDTTVVEKVCGNGQTCQVDACADGAYCCDAAPPPVNECDEIGTRGVCTADGKVRWCSNGNVQEVTCVTGKTCQIDACGDGAYCCTP